jgi:peptide/histidine transporter 3/4
MATDAAVADEDGSLKKTKQGGFKTMPFILGDCPCFHRSFLSSDRNSSTFPSLFLSIYILLRTTDANSGHACPSCSCTSANEICDRFATAGFNANMITYLTQQLHLPLVEASNLLTNFNGTAAFTPVLGAIIADSCAGRFWTIAGGGALYQLGMLGLVVSALVPALRPASCVAGAGATATATASSLCQRASGGQLAMLYVSLLLTALGGGGIRPCVVAFGADQFGFSLRGRRPGGEQKWSYFNLYFFSMGLAVLLALTVVVYIQENVGWGWGFGIPAIAMFVSVLSFVVGYPLYVKVKPQGSPFKRLLQVVVAAFKKRKESVPEDFGLLYQNKELDAPIAADGRLLHTDQLRQVPTIDFLLQMLVDLMCIPMSFC